MTVAQEEIFGPVVTVIPFEDEKDAIRIANDVALRADGDGLDGRPGARATGSRARIKSGTVGINMPYTAFPGIPFGGYKQSGFGRELGLETLELYLETKSVIVSTSAAAVQPLRAVDASSYRWAVLAAGHGGAGELLGAPDRACRLAPALREEYDLALSRGRAPARGRVGRARSLTLLAVGLRSPTGSASGVVLAIGLGGCGVLVAALGAARLRGARRAARRSRARPARASTSASGRAVMQWFAPRERGLALGVRQTAIPLGGADRRRSSLPPSPSRRVAPRRRSSSSAGSASLAALVGCAVVREAPERGACSSRRTSSGRFATAASGCSPAAAGSTSSRRSRSFASSSSSCTTSTAHRGRARPACSPCPRRSRCASRIGAGPLVGRARLADRAAAPDRPRDAVAFAAAAARCSTAPVAVVVPSLVLAAGAVRWRGTGSRSPRPPSSPGARAAAPRSASSRRCSPVSGVVVPPLFATLVEVTSWRTAFALAALAPLAGWVLLGRVRA